MKRKNIIISILSTLLIVGCNKEVVASSSSNEEPLTYPTLNEALANTSNYALSPSSRNDGIYYEVSLDNFYYLDSYRKGIIIPDVDSDYYYSMENQYFIDIENDTYKQRMIVHGKVAPIEQFADVTQNKLLNTLIAYSEEFYAINDSTWACPNQELANIFETFFQNNGYSYTNYYEITTNTNGRIHELKLYERELKDKYLVASYTFHNITLEDYAPYQLWVENGKLFDTRIYDLKVGYYKDDNTYVSPYQDDLVSIEGIVAAIDADKNIYIAQENSSTGNIAIKTKLSNKNSLPSLNDIIKVTGKITMDEYVPYFTDASYEKTGTAKYAPIFDEERVVDLNGGGIYATEIFMQTPYYADSVYSTYAYAESYPDSLNANEDTLIDLICPTFTSVEGTYYHMQLVIPNNLNSTKKTEIFEIVKTFGKYQVDGENNVELSIQNSLIKFDTSYEFVIKLIVTDNTTISKRLNVTEKVEKYVGVSSFPVIENVKTMSYRFGGASNMFIENNYGSNKNDIEGLFICFDGVTLNNSNDYLNSLISLGFNKIDEVKDASSSRHQLYTYGNDVCLDILILESSSGNEYVIQMWIYQGDLLRLPTIEESLKTEIPFLEEFIKLNNTFDADYTHYELLNFAGHDFSKDNPLHCITLDSNEDLFEDYKQALLDAGYTTYRDANNRLYSYMTRGSNHYIYQKNDVFIDIAQYPTTDYTFYGHNKFQWRIEIMIYQGTQPLDIKYEENLDGFMNNISKLDENYKFNVDLPSEVKIEWSKALGTYDYIEYGYHHIDELFVYADNIDELYNAFVAGLEAAGYIAGGTGKKSQIYSKQTDTGYSYITLMKETERGFLRVMNSVGGVDF